MQSTTMIQKEQRGLYRCLMILSMAGGFYSYETVAQTPDTNKKPNSAAHNNYTGALHTASSTLEAIIKESITRHPSIDADKEALSASDDVVDQAVAAYMPSVDVRMSAGRETIRRDFQVSTLNPLPSQGKISSTRTDPSISVKQVLFDGMGTASRVERARSQQQQARGNLGVTRDSIIIDAATVAIDIRRLQRLYQVVLKNIEFHQSMRDKINQIVQAGAAPISDLYQVESRLQDTFISQSNILSDLEGARAKFIEVIGKEPPAFINPVHLPGDLIASSAEKAVRMALDHNNALKVARSNVKIADANYKETASKLMPTVSFEVEAEKDRNVVGSIGTQDRFTAIVVARHNLFNGGADMSRSRETGKKVTEARARLEFARRQIEHTVRNAWGQMYNARIKSSYLEKLSYEKRQIRDTYVQEFFLGKRSLTDILDAANDVLTTEAAHITSDSTADTNAVTVIVATGQFKKFMEEAKGKRVSGPSSKPMDMHMLHAASPLSQNRPLPSAASGELINMRSSTQDQNLPQPRKSIYKKRKDSRQNASQNTIPLS